MTWVCHSCVCWGQQPQIQVLKVNYILFTIEIVSCYLDKLVVLKLPSELLINSGNFLSRKIPYKTIKPSYKHNEKSYNLTWNKKFITRFYCLLLRFCLTWTLCLMNFRHSFVWRIFFVFLYYFYCIIWHAVLLMSFRLINNNFKSH